MPFHCPSTALPPPFHRPSTPFHALPSGQPLWRHQGADCHCLPLIATDCHCLPLLATQVNLSGVTKALLLNRRVVAALRACPAFAALDALQLSMMAYGGTASKLKRYGVLYRWGAPS